MEKCLAVFVFPKHTFNSEFDTVCQTDNNIVVSIYQHLLRSPFVGMKQPVPHGGMLGLQCILEAKKQDFKTDGLCFVLYRNTKEIQRGALNNGGEYRGLSINFPDPDSEYVLQIFESDNLKN